MDILNKTQTILIGLVLTMMILPTFVYGEKVEFDGEYFIDSPNAYIIIGVNSDGNTELLEGSMFVNGEWQTWEDVDLKFSRVASDGEQGRFFGESNTGDLFYGRYSIVDEPTLFIKIWIEDTKVKIIEQAILQSLF